MTMDIERSPFSRKATKLDWLLKAVTAVVSAGIAVTSLSCSSARPPKAAVSRPLVTRALSPEILQLKTIYMAKEGVDARGSHFADLAMALNMEVTQGERWSRADVENALGPADLTDPNTAAYFYDRFARKDWAVYFRWGPTDNLQIEWNDASVNQELHKKMQPRETALRP